MTLDIFHMIDVRIYIFINTKGNYNSQKVKYITKIDQVRI